MSFVSLSGPKVEMEEMKEELRRMSEEEKDAAHRDLYGGAPLSTVSEEEEQALLQQMREEVNSIADESKRAYLMAMERCPEHAASDSFQLKFLRTDDHEPKKAAKRMTQFWEEKVRLFGEEHSFRERLYSSCLHPTETTIFEKLAICPLPHRDRGGRSVLYLRRGLLSGKRNEIDCNLRVLFFSLYHMLMNNNTLCQRQGFVWLVLIDSTFAWQDYNRVQTKKARRLMDVFPMKVASFHHIAFQQHDMLNRIMPLVWFLMGKAWRARYRLHQEDDMADNTENLKAHGLFETMLPQELGGELDTTATVSQFLQDTATPAL